MFNGKIRIGLIVDYLTSEYSESLMHSIQKFCNKNDIELLFFTIGELHANHATYGYQNVAITSLINEKNIDGLIMTSGTQMHGTSRQDFIDYLKTYDPLPIVNIASELDDYPSVVSDYTQTFDDLIQHLINTQNCKKIGYIDAESNSNEIIQRRKIFQNVLKRNGIPDDNVVYWKADLEYGSTYNVLLESLKKNNYNFDIDTIVAVSDECAYACIDFIRNHTGKRIPEDVIVTGFDDLHRASFFDPGLTSINQKVDEQGYKAAETLIKMIKGKKVPKLQVVKASGTLRKSSERVVIDSKTKLSPNLRIEKVSKNLFKNKELVMEWYNRRTQMFSAARFYAEKEANVLVSAFPTLITEELQGFGFHSAIIVLYDKPIEKEKNFEHFDLPNKAKAIGYDYNKGFSTKKIDYEIEFNPQEMLAPPECINYYNNGSVVIALFYGIQQFGYIIIGCGNYDVGVYDIISRSIGSQIHSCLSYTSLIETQYSLNDRFKRLDILAHTDELTGLKNRRGLMELGTSMITYSEAMGQKGLVVFCDMDGLKKINDTYGHEEGDIAIKAQAAILAKSFRSNDMVARIAGDEFAIISPGLSFANFNTIKDKIDADCKEWSLKNKKPYTLSISLGASEFPDKNGSYDLTVQLSKADIALYKEKNKKKSKK